jgi:hypothetical protein
MVVLQAISEGFIKDDSIAIDATHFEARDQAPSKEDKPEITPKKKKRGRKSKAEREQWLIEQAEHEANLPLFKKKIKAQLDVPLMALRKVVPQDPEWGVKKNSEGKNVFWFLIRGDSKNPPLFMKDEIHLIKGVSQAVFHRLIPLNHTNLETTFLTFTAKPFHYRVSFELPLLLL